MGVVREEAAPGLGELLDLDGDQPPFVGRCHAGSPGRAFGGHLVALAILAATRTVRPTRPVHSVHATFLQPARPGEAIMFDVDPVRDGTRFSTRVVGARQDERAVLTMVASFHDDEPGPAPPLVAARAALAAPPDLVSDDPDTPAHPIRSVLSVRSAPDDGDGTYRMWIRTRACLDDRPATHAAALAYMADTVLPMAAVAALRGRDPAVVPTASLDFAMWFHRGARADEWLLFDGACQTFSGSKGLARLDVRNRAGELVASAAQEVLVRRAVAS